MNADERCFEKAKRTAGHPQITQISQIRRGSGHVDAYMRTDSPIRPPRFTLPPPPRFHRRTHRKQKVANSTFPGIAFPRPPLYNPAVGGPEYWVGQDYEAMQRHISSEHVATIVPDTFSPTLSGHEECPQIAMIEIPPYDPQEMPPEDDTRVLGRLSSRKEWFVTTPVVVITMAGIVKAAWEDEAPDPETILDEVLGSWMCFSGTPKCED